MRFVSWSLLKSGVPVKPMKAALGSASRMLRASLPACVRCASSEITMMSSRRLYGLSRSTLWLNLWIRLKT